MKLRRYQITLLVVGMLFLLGTGLGYYRRTRNPELRYYSTLRTTRSSITLRLAGEAFQNGQVVQAIPLFAEAVWQYAEGGLRWTVAGPHIEQMSALSRAGRLSEALDECLKAQRILRSYSVEGSIGYECSAIDTRIMIDSMVDSGKWRKVETEGGFYVVPVESEP